MYYCTRPYLRQVWDIYMQSTQIVNRFQEVEVGVGLHGDWTDAARYCPQFNSFKTHQGVPFLQFSELTNYRTRHTCDAAVLGSNQETGRTKHPLKRCWNLGGVGLVNPRCCSRRNPRYHYPSAARVVLGVRLPYTEGTPQFGTP